MSYQSFSTKSNKPKINTLDSTSFQQRTTFRNFSYDSGTVMNYGDEEGTDYNNVAPNKEQSYYEFIANEMLKDLVIGKNDPVTNRENTRVLQSAMDFLSEHGGGTLNLPAGEIYFGQGGSAGTTPWGEKFAIICRSNVHLKGAGTKGVNATILKPVCVFAEGEASSMDMFFFNHYSTGEPAFTKAPDGTNFDYNYKADYTYTDAEGNQVVLKNDNFYLTNADYSDFVIDGSNVKGNKGSYQDANGIWRNYYTSAGKGFMINLFKDCDWNNVVVKDTDATGFGMDCPINCTVTNCVAIGCGKQAKDTDGGASGFGIGAGYSNNESIVLANCKSYNNTKYGIFFEHQSRFQTDTTRYPSTTSNGFLVTNCEAGGNLYDFGGVKANDVTFKNVKSVTEESSLYQNSDLLYRDSGALVATPLGTNSSSYVNLVGSDLDYSLDRPINSDYTKQHLYFSEYSVNCHVENSNLYTNITDFGPYATEISDAINSGAMKLKSTTEFGSSDSMSRMDVMQALFRYAGLPNEMNTTSRADIGKKTLESIQNYGGRSNNFGDLNNENYTKEEGGLEAVLWGINNGIVVPDVNFNPDSVCTRSQLVTMLYRMSGSPKPEGTVPFTDVESDTWYSDALTWAYNEGIIKGVSTTEFAPNRALTKAEMAIMLSRYTNNLEATPIEV